MEGVHHRLPLKNEIFRPLRVSNVQHQHLNVEESAHWSVSVATTPIGNITLRKEA